jgi:hypothetical protein
MLSPGQEIQIKKQRNFTVYQKLGLQTKNKKKNENIDN